MAGVQGSQLLSLCSQWRLWPFGCEEKATCGAWGLQKLTACGALGVKKHLSSVRGGVDSQEFCSRCEKSCCCC